MLHLRLPPPVIHLLTLRTSGKAALYGLGLAFVGPLGTLSHGYVAAETPRQVTCDNLSIKLSDDKNHYIFSVKAGGDAASITSYTFDFGDKQSYRFNFEKNSTQDRRTAAATHAYQKASKYTAVVHVHTKSQQGAAGITSGNCQASVDIQPPTGRLPETGVTNTVGLFAGLSVGAAVLHNFWLRWRNRT